MKLVNHRLPLTASLACALVLAACSQGTVHMKAPEPVLSGTPTDAPAAAPTEGLATETLAEPTSAEAFADLSIREKEKAIEAATPVYIGTNLTQHIGDEGQISTQTVKEAEQREKAVASYETYLMAIHSKVPELNTLNPDDLEIIFVEPTNSNTVGAAKLFELNMAHRGRKTLSLAMSPGEDTEAMQAFLVESIRIAKLYASIQKITGTNLTVPENEYRDKYPEDAADLRMRGDALELFLGFVSEQSNLDLIKALEPNLKQIYLGESSIAPKAVHLHKNLKSLSILTNRGMDVVKAELETLATKPEVTAEAKPVAKPVTKPLPKPAPKLDVKPEVKPDIKPAVGRIYES